jgi:hypothetical protein
LKPLQINQSPINSGFESTFAVVLSKVPAKAKAISQITHAPRSRWHLRGRKSQLPKRLELNVPVENVAYQCHMK